MRTNTGTNSIHSRQSVKGVFSCFRQLVTARIPYCFHRRLSTFRGRGYPHLADGGGVTPFLPNEGGTPILPDRGEGTPTLPEGQGYPILPDGGKGGVPPTGTAQHVLATWQEEDFLVFLDFFLFCYSATAVINVLCI